jgi:hypothetical protein
MCLLISPYQELNDRDLKRWFGNRKKFAYVYKILYKSPDEDFYRSENYRNFKWDFKNQKVFQVDRPNRPTKFELKTEEINTGLHVYTNLETAKKNRYCKVIVKFKVLKEDIVAIENYYCGEEFNFPHLVCTKLEFVKIVED